MKNKQIDPRNKSKPTSDKISSHDALVAIGIIFINNVLFMILPDSEMYEKISKSPLF